jgi:hypothetical protein
MKSIKLISASVMIAGASVAYAQDSTTISIPPPPVQPQDQATPPDQVRQDQMNFKKNMVVIQPSDVPASLRTTLKGSQYKGWEGGVIYRNQTSDMFMVEMRDGNQTRLYRFDQNGKPVKDY